MSSIFKTAASLLCVTAILTFLTEPYNITPTYAKTAIGTYKVNHPASALAPATLRTYVSGDYLPIRNAQIPLLSTNKKIISPTMIPAVRVSTSYAVVTNPILSTPSFVLADVPKSLAAKMEAYFVQMNANTSFYLIGPRAMTGSAQLAADGSFSVYLHNANASIELDTSGGSVVTAAGMSSGFFHSARSFLRQSFSSNSQAIEHTTISRPNQQTALFAFKMKHHRLVTGYDFYQSATYPYAAFGPSSLMVYSATKKDWPYAKWVLHTGLQALYHIGEPQIGGRVIPQENSPIRVDSGSTTAGRIMPIHKGLVWIQSATYVQKGPITILHSRFPIAPYMLLKGAAMNGRLIPNSGVELTNIPWMRVESALNDPLYAYPFLLRPSSNRWIPYVVTWAGYNMNQPASNDLCVYDLSTGTDRHITSFPLFGGMFFSVGTSGQYLAYDKSGIINAKGAMGHNLWLVNLITGQQAHLPASDLIKNDVQVSINGQPVTISLGGFIQ